MYRLSRIDAHTVAQYTEKNNQTFSLYFAMAYWLLHAKVSRSVGSGLNGQDTNVNNKHVMLNRWNSSCNGVNRIFYCPLLTILNESLCFLNLTHIMCVNICVVSCPLSWTSWVGSLLLWPIAIWHICVDMTLNGNCSRLSSCQITSYLKGLLTPKIVLCC